MKLSTFSIVARDTQTGLIGIAGGTNWFNYGRWVPHVEAGAGALATQAETNMWYAPNGLEDLKKDLTAEETVNDMLTRDVDKDGVYQLLVIDNNGNTFCHTGENCHLYAGHICEQDVAVAGNTLVGEETLIAVIGYFKNSNEPLALRMIKSLQAGQKAGGDIRGMKSAALKIAKGTGSGKYWNDISYDLRVDESTDPLKELERLYYVAEAYRCVNDAECTNNPVEALEFYKKGLELDPDNTEIKFWIARIYDSLGNEQESTRLREEIRQVNENWDEYWERLNKTKE